MMKRPEFTNKIERTIAKIEVHCVAVNELCFQ